MVTNDDDIGAIDAQEEENYFVSLTDLMTGVVFIFVILLVTYAMTFNSAKDELEEERARAEAASSEAGKAEVEAEQFKKRAKQTKEELDRELLASREKAEKIDALARVLKQREEQRRKILEDVVSRLKEKGIKVTLDPDNGVIRLPEALLFDSAQSTLRPEGSAALQVVAGELSQVLERWCAPDEDFRLEALFIEGHTDSNPIKTAKFADNWELSTSRAVSISRALTQANPDLLEYRNPSGLPVIGVSAYGENRPVDDNSTDEGRRKNRRIDLRFILAYPTDEQISKVTEGLASP